MWIGNRILGGASDGSIHIWNERKSYSRADIILRGDYASQLISSVVISPDGSLLAARALEDNCVLVWDFASISTSQTPVMKLTNIHNDYPTANVDFRYEIYCCC